jgi:hypothetical protein
VNYTERGGQKQTARKQLLTGEKAADSGSPAHYQSGFSTAGGEAALLATLGAMLTKERGQAHLPDHELIMVLVNLRR